MVIIALPGLRVGVHQRRGQPRQRMQEIVLGADRDLVRLRRTGTGIDDHLTFGAQLVPDPAQPDLANIQSPGRGVAVARYEPAGEGVADIAVVVRPDWRRAGLGTVLIRCLAQAALERGIHAFSASYLAENRPVAALVEDAGGLGRQVIKRGVAEFSLALAPQWPARGPDGDAAGRG